MLCLSSCCHLLPVSLHVLGLGHDLQVARVVVVLVAVDVVDDLVSLQRPAKHLFGNHTMLMPAVKLAVSVGLDLLNTAKLRGPVVGSPLPFWRHVVGIAVATNALRVHPAHPARSFFRRVVAAFDAANLGHAMPG